MSKEEGCVSLKVAVLGAGNGGLAMGAIWP
jgi:hypothetical protein